MRWKMQHLFALGSNSSGQLGIGHTSDVSVPKPALLPDSIPASDRIISIAAGGNHTLLLTSSGTVLCAGDATSGATGAPVITDADADTPSQPHRSHFLPLSLPSSSDKKAALVSATWTTTHIALGTPPTRLYSLGTGRRGELGLGPLIMRTPTPTLVAGFPPRDSPSPSPPDTHSDAVASTDTTPHIIQLCSSMAHTVAVLSDGTVWGWGAARKGQLGPLGTTSSASPPSEDIDGVVSTPRRIEGLAFPVTRAACGKEFTALFGPRETGEVVVLGADKWGVRTKIPAREELTGWVDVGASWGSVHVLRADGRVVSWGRDDHGQLAPGDLPRAIKLAVGSEHALILSEEGEVTAWGWGEHGNCGPEGGDAGGKGQRGVIASLKYVPKGASISSIGAGCATSWVIINIIE